MTLITKPLPSALRDPSGAFIPPGTMRKTYSHNPVFHDEPIPSWITAGGMTSITPTTGAAPYPGIEILTSTSANSVMAFGPELQRTPYLAASALTLRGVMSLQPAGEGSQGGRHSIALRLSTGNSDGSDVGAALISQAFTAVSSPSVSQDGSTRLRAFNSGNLIEKPSIHRYFNPKDGGVFEGATLCLLVHWQLGMVYAFEGDFETGDCVNVISAPGVIRYADETPIRPRATIAHLGSGGRTPAPLRVGAVQVDHWFY